MTDENFPVCSVLDKVISDKTNSLVGNNDVNLNTLVKVSLMDEMKVMDANKKENIINEILATNLLEHYFINKEYELTYDMNGNVIPVNCIENGEGDFKSGLYEPEGSKKET